MNCTTADRGGAMKDFLQKAWLFGLGVFDFTREKVDALVAEMVQRGEITQQEGPEAVKQIMAKAQEAQQAMMDRVKELISDMKFARAADLKALEKRLAALEALERRVAHLEENLERRVADLEQNIQELQVME